MSQVKYAVNGTDKYLIYDYKAYRFGITGLFIGESTNYFANAMPVNVMSIAIMGTSYEIAINVGSTFKKYTSKLSAGEFTTMLTQYGQFYVCMLRKDSIVGGRNIRQMLIVCRNDVNPTVYLDSTAQEVKS